MGQVDFVDYIESEIRNLMHVAGFLFIFFLMILVARLDISQSYRHTRSGSRKPKSEG